MFNRARWRGRGASTGGAPRPYSVLGGVRRLDFPPGSALKNSALRRPLAMAPGGLILRAPHEVETTDDVRQFRLGRALRARSAGQLDQRLGASGHLPLCLLDQRHLPVVGSPPAGFGTATLTSTARVSRLSPGEHRSLAWADRADRERHSDRVGRCRFGQADAEFDVDEYPLAQD
jgi:hypothetical protein